MGRGAFGSDRMCILFLTLLSFLPNFTYFVEKGRSCVVGFPLRSDPTRRVLSDVGVPVGCRGREESRGIL